MARVVKKTHLGSLSTPVIDLSTIIVISLLTLGSIQALVPALELEELNWIQRDENQAEVEPSDSPEEVVAKLSREYQALQGQLAQAAKPPQGDHPQAPEQTKADGNQPMELRALVTAYTERVDLLRQQLGQLRNQEQDLKDLNDVLGDRDSETEKLWRQYEELAREFDRVNARLAGYERMRSKFATAEKAVDPNRAHQEGVRTRWLRTGSIEGRVIVLLAASRVFIMEPPYVEQYRAPGVLYREPRGSGMSLAEAVTPDSPLMRIISRPSFQKEGWILILVNQDSFASYRALRDALTEAGVQVGWEPHEGKIIGLSSEGRSSGPQGSR
jgi:prefoldin subunit 5